MRELNERRKCILRAITDVYIDTAEPVGSTTIARKHNLGISSATIRNEMASLEEEGMSTSLIPQQEEFHQIKVIVIMWMCFWRFPK